VIFCANPAWAKDSGPYVSGQLGFSIPSDSDNSVGGTTISTATFDPGPHFGAALGYKFNKHFRLEGELAYRTFDADQIQFFGIGFPLSGDVSAVSFMANGYYDFPVEGVWQPYLGLGIGGASVSADLTSLITFPLDDSATVFAYQIMAGLGYEFSPSTILTGGYRFFATADPEFKDSVGNIIESEVSAHEFSFGVRYLF